MEHFVEAWLHHASMFTAVVSFSLRSTSMRNRK
jgi:hypothetical protein